MTMTIIECLKRIKFLKLFFEDENLNRVQSGLEGVFLIVDSNFTCIQNEFASIEVWQVGDVKTSCLTETQFQTLHGAAWVLADGRSVVGTAYAALTELTSVPDLRGKFVRGSNGSNPLLGVQADSTAVNGLNQGLTGTAPSLTGTTAFADTGHNHTAGSLGAHIVATGIPAQLRWKTISDTFTAAFRWPSGGNAETDTSSYPKTEVSGTTSAPGSAGAAVGIQNGNYSLDAMTGDTETRPENVALNYFVKVN